MIEIATVPVFPARAGMIPDSATHPNPYRCIPRESGDDPEWQHLWREALTYSPRERG